MANLGKFEGRSVSGTTIAITNAGDGLSKALAVEPRVLNQHDEVYVVLKTKVDRIAFIDSKDDPEKACIRVHTLKAGEATIVDEALVAEVLADQRRRLEEAEGVYRLPGTEGEAPPEEG